MKRFILALALTLFGIGLVLIFTDSAFADGTVPSPPTPSPIATYKIEGINETQPTTSPARIIITVVWYRANINVDYVQQVIVEGASIGTYFAATETAVAGEPAGASTVNRAKRRRMRADKFLRDNALLLYPVTPES